MATSRRASWGFGTKGVGGEGLGVAFRPVCQLIAGDKVAISANEKSLT